MIGECGQQVMLRVRLDELKQNVIRAARTGEHADAVCDLGEEVVGDELEPA